MSTQCDRTDCFASFAETLLDTALFQLQPAKPRAHQIGSPRRNGFLSRDTKDKRLIRLLYRLTRVHRNLKSGVGRICCRQLRSCAMLFADGSRNVITILFASATDLEVYRKSKTFLVSESSKVTEAKVGKTRSSGQR